MEGIHADLRMILDAAKQSSPVDFDVIEGLRSIDRQREMVAKGASKTLNSRHLTGHAVDIWPIDPKTGRRARSDDALLWSLLRPIAAAVKGEARRAAVPIVWGGDWKSFPDGPHFELARAEYPPDEPRPAVPEPEPEPATPPSIWARIGAFFLAIWRNRKEPEL